MMHRLLLFAPSLVLAAPPVADLPKVTKVERQPLAAQVQRLVEALDFLGAPLAKADKKALTGADVKQIQGILDKHCLAGVRIGKGSIEVKAGPAKPELAEQGWRVFLVKVENPSCLDKAGNAGGKPQRLAALQPHQQPNPRVASVEQIKQRFLDLEMYGKQPLVRDLSGLELEYRILQVFCRDAGRKEARLRFRALARYRQRQTNPRNCQRTAPPRRFRKPARGAGRAGGEGRRRQAGDGHVHLPRPDGSDLPIAKPPPGPGLSVSIPRSTGPTAKPSRSSRANTP